MEIYKHKHTSKKALNSHIDKIKERGGKYKVNGMEIEYSFPLQKTSINPRKNLPISKIDTSFLKKDKTNNDLFSYTIAGRGDNEEIVYTKKTGNPTKNEVYKIIELITDFKKKQLGTKEYSEYIYEINVNGKGIALVKYKQLSILMKFVNTKKLKSFGSINEFF